MMASESEKSRFDLTEGEKLKAYVESLRHRPPCSAKVQVPDYMLDVADPWELPYYGR